MQGVYSKVKEYVKKHEGRMSSVALLFGFILDNITLQRIDLWYGNALLFFYIVLAGVTISLINLYDSGRWRPKILHKMFPWLPVVLQFVFGNLFSGYFVYYFRSASLVSSWFFIVLLVGLLFANERFRTKYLQFQFQITIYYVVIFSYLIFIFPVMFHTISAWIFVLSGIVGLAAIVGFVYLVYLIIPWRVQQSVRYLMVSIGGIYLVVNTMYFANIIPPIPLALKDAGVYHGVERVSDGYVGNEEVVPWYAYYKKFRPTFHRHAGEPIYFYSSVFSPTNLNTEVVHQWAYFDVSKDAWIQSSRISYSIVGGRDGGYRGYSIKESVFPGKWRVDVLTVRGQLLGRHTFNIVDVSEPVPERMLSL